jgi:Isocitrate/isopropylmalate dehydrogenase
MAKYTVVSMPGDGIGKVVLPEAIRVLDAVGFDAEYVHGNIGWDFWCSEGNALPDRTIDLLEKHKLGLFGAITSKPKKEADAELDPSLSGKGYTYYSPIVTMRQRFNLDICLRPCRSFPGNPLNFIRRKGEAFEEPPVDAVIFRQNTEGSYTGVEWTNPPQIVKDALASHPRFKSFLQTPGEDLAVSTRIVTRIATRRIITAAFEYAKKYGYKSVTVAEKPNVLRETSGMIEEEAKKIQKESFSGIELWSTNIDAMMMWLTKNPENYGVLVAENLFGDIISDAFAGLVGGLGFACSGNIGERVAVFEPTHGSAPKYEKLDPPIVNPIAMILSAAMLLDHVGEVEKANRVRAAIAHVVKEGKVRTYDMMRLTGGPKVFAQGAATSAQLTDAVLAALKVAAPEAMSVR